MLIFHFYFHIGCSISCRIRLFFAAFRYAAAAAARATPHAALTRRFTAHAVTQRDAARHYRDDARYLPLSARQRDTFAACARLSDLFLRLTLRFSSLTPFSIDYFALSDCRCFLD
jgi:hypothetical protein